MSANVEELEELEKLSVIMWPLLKLDRLGALIRVGGGGLVIKGGGGIGKELGMVMTDADEVHDEVTIEENDEEAGGLMGLILDE